MSPNEQKMTSGRCAMACALSIISSDVTQTGQPGPCTSSISLGNSRSIPYLTMVWVCPPQTSIRTHGLVVMRRISSTTFLPESRRGIRPEISSAACRLHWPWINIRNVQLAELFHFLEKLVCTRRFTFIYLAQRKADMNQDIIAGLDLRRVFETDLFQDAAEICAAHLHARRIGRDLDQLTWNRQAHGFRSS